MQSVCNLKPKKEAAAFGGQAARENSQQATKYRLPARLSTKIPKIIIGQALLFGDKRNPEFWLVFEALLRAVV